VARLMRAAGIRGARRGKRVRTTKPDLTVARHPDLVKRKLSATAPNQLWVTDLVRREVLFDRVEVRDHHVPAVAAAG